MLVASLILLSRTAWTLMLALGLAAVSAQAQQPVYPTYGVHNPPADSPCTNADCIYVRQSGEPTDPRYPEFWSSNWHMYRVFQGYAIACSRGLRRTRRRPTGLRPPR
jgi:hypothetical protein